MLDGNQSQMTGFFRVFVQLVVFMFAYVYYHVSFQVQNSYCHWMHFIINLLFPIVRYIRAHVMYADTWLCMWNALCSAAVNTVNIPYGIKYTVAVLLLVIHKLVCGWCPWNTEQWHILKHKFVAAVVQQRTLSLVETHLGIIFKSLLGWSNEQHHNDSTSNHLLEVRTPNLFNLSVTLLAVVSICRRHCDLLNSSMSTPSLQLTKFRFT